MVHECHAIVSGLNNLPTLLGFPQRIKNRLEILFSKLTRRDARDEAQEVEVLQLIGEGMIGDRSLSERIMSKVRFMTIVLSGLTATGVVVKMIFNVMPEVMQGWFIDNYAPAFLRARTDTANWCAEVLGLVQCGTIPHVFVSQEYSFYAALCSIKFFSIVN